MKKTIFLLAFCLTITGVYAQQTFSIKGKVVDADDKECLIGASVYNQVNGDGTTTDINGKYFFSEAEAGDVLLVSYIGYISDFHNIEHSGTQPDIELEKDTGFVLQSKIPFSSYDKYTEEQSKQ